MIRNRLLILGAIAALALAACSKGPSEPMPGGDDMMQTPATTDTVGR